MNRRDFLGLIPKATILASLPVSAMALVSDIPDITYTVAMNPYGVWIVRADFEYKGRHTGTVWFEDVNTKEEALEEAKPALLGWAENAIERVNTYD